jgi:small GTP-binding protein
VSTTTSQATTASTTAPTKPTPKPTKEDSKNLKDEKSAKKIPVKEGPDDYQYSLVIIGESGVGKTALLSRFTDRKFNASVQPTEGIDFVRQSVMVEQKKVGLEIWDTAGDERTRVPTTFYQDCLAVLAVYDIGCSESFENIYYWIVDAEKFAKRAEVKVLIGNKSDGERAVTYQAGSEFAKSKGMVFYEVSAKSSENVDDLFQNIGAVIKKQFNK